MAQGSIKIGRIAGIDISLHWTFVLLILFALLSLSQGVTFAILLAILFVSVLLHELSHSYTALKNGIPVNGISINIIGGASSIDPRKLDARTEFNISITGPLSSFLIGAVAGVFVTLTPAGLATLALQWFFELNIALGVLNILPAFPLDGGRIFRSYLERSKDKLQATLITAKITNYMAGIFFIASMAALFVPVNFATKYAYFFTLIIVAVLLYAGAQGERDNALLRRDTQGLKALDIISKDFIIVDKDTSIAKLYKIALSEKKHTILTMVNGKVMYVDLKARPTSSAYNAADLSIAAPEITGKESVFDSLYDLEANNAKVAAVVTNKGKIIGVITPQRLQAFIALHVLNKRSRKSFNT